MFQKNKMKNFPQRSALTVALFALAIGNANAATVKVKVKHSDGTPAVGATVQYVTSQFYALGTTDANGEIVNTNVPNGINYKLKVVYNNTTFTTATPTNSGTAISVNEHEFSTSKLTVVAKSCNTPVKDVAISFVGNGGSYYSLGFTNANGELSYELFGKDSLKVRALSKGSMQDNYVTTFPANSTVNLQLDKLTISGGYYLASSSWYTANGAYVFPGKYRVRMMNNQFEDSLDVNSCTVGKYPLVVRLVDSKSNPLEGAGVSYYYNGWKTMSNTGVNGYSVALVDVDPVNITTAVSYEGGSQQKTGTTGNTVKYQTRNFTVNFKNSQSSPLEADVISYYANGWKTFTNTSNGVAKKELLPYAYTVALGYKGASEQKSCTVADSVINFKTRNYAVNFVNSTNQPMTASSISYYANGWQNYTTAANGTTNMEMLPYAYTFALGYGGASQQKTITVADSIVNYNTYSVNLEIKDCNGNVLTGDAPSYYANGWHSFGDNGTWTMEMLPYNHTFAAGLNGSSTQKTVSIFNNTTVTLWAGELLIGQLSPFSTASYYANGWKSFPMNTPNRVAINLFAGNYAVSVNGVQSTKTVVPCVADAPLRLVNKEEQDGVRGGVTSVKVYPNPVVNEINVEVPYDGNVVIYTIDGKKAMSQSITAGKTTLDVSNLHTGNYLMVVQYADFTETIKIVK